MKTKLNFKGQEFEIDSESNERVYTGLSFGVEALKQDKVISYYLFNRDKLFSIELIRFLKLAGIDPTKENEIFYFPMDNKIVVEGWYDIIGKVLTNNAASFHWQVDQCTTNAHFGNDSRHGMLGDFKYFETFRLDFSIVIPNEILKD